MLEVTTLQKILDKSFSVCGYDNMPMHDVYLRSSNKFFSKRMSQNISQMTSFLDIPLKVIAMHFTLVNDL